MKKSNYLSERLERLLKGDIRRSKITQIRIKRGYKRAFQLIEDDIAKYVTRISDDLKLDTKALKRKIPKEELLSRAKELKLEEETMANYENLSYAEAIRREMVKNVESMAKENESLIFENLFKTYEHNFYSSSYLLYRTMDDFSFTKRVTKEYFDWMAKKPWTSDGKTFSDRIWKDQKTLVDELYKEFTVSATRGANLKEAARRMSRKMDVSYKKCLRLLNTEDSFFSNKAVMDAYQNTTAEEYMILATLDRKTCEICGDQDTKHYMIKDAKVGVNMPPFHPNCRCTTVVYFGDEDDMPEERMMRDENGKSVKTEYMSYDEWKKKYVDDISDEFKGMTVEEIARAYGYDPLEASKVVNTLRDDSKGWIDKLTNDEKRAINKYTYNGVDLDGLRLFEKINGYLEYRYTPNNKDEEEIIMRNIYNIHNGLLKNKLKHDIIVYRNDLEPESLNNPVKKFLSTSVTRKGATGNNPNVAIIVPRGSNGAYVEELADEKFKKQREFLLNKNTVLKKICKKDDMLIYLVKGDLK